MNNRKSISVLKSVLGNKVVSYHSVFARALRSVPAAVMLSQAYFWQENASFKEISDFEGRPFFTKTAAQWYEATGVTDDAQVTAREVLRKSGIWIEKKAGLPAKLYFHVDLETLVSVIYGYLENGIQVTVDSRHKNREITRASDGKFRPQVSGVYGNNTKVESTREGFESTYGEATTDQKNSDSEQKKEKAPPMPLPPPKQLFAHSEWMDDPSGFAAAIQSRFPVVPAETDFQYYFRRCLDWSNSKSAMSNDWIKIAVKFTLDDQWRGELHTYQQKQTGHANYTRNHPVPSQPILDTASIAGITQRVAARRRLRNGQ